MELVVNGKTQSVPDQVRVSELVQLLGLPDSGVAIAVNDTVIPKGRWADTSLERMQRIEVLTAVQGG